MVDVIDGTTIAYGFVFAIKPVPVYEDLPDGSRRRTDRFDGVRVTLACGDGMVVVKVPEDAKGVIAPAGTAVAWIIRTGFYRTDDGRTGVASRFEREVNMGDLDAIHSTVNAKASASK